MKCYECRQAHMFIERGTVNYDFSGLPYEVTLLNVPVHRYPNCDERAESIPDPGGLHRVIGLHIVERNQRLAGAEVRGSRASLNQLEVDLGAAAAVAANEADERRE